MSESQNTRMIHKEDTLNVGICKILCCGNSVQFGIKGMCSFVILITTECLTDFATCV